MIARSLGASLRLSALDLAIRMTVKRRLATVTDPEVPRRNFELEARLFRGPPGTQFRHEAVSRPGDGALQILHAERNGSDRGVLLYFHGGGFLCGSPRTHRHLAAGLAFAAEMKAAITAYRLAPEHPYPAALDDAMLSWRHLLASGHAPERIALAGDSAGGGLAFSLLLRIEAEGGPRPGAVVAFSPWADMTGRSAALRRNAESDCMLPASRFGDMTDFYLNGHDPADPYVSPVLGTFRDPPPALIFASSTEILADDASALTGRLRAAGGEADLQIWPGLPHAWPYFTGFLPEADEAVAQAGAFLRRHLR